MRFSNLVYSYKNEGKKHAALWVWHIRVIAKHQNIEFIQRYEE